MTEWERMVKCNPELQQAAKDAAEDFSRKLELLKRSDELLAALKGAVYTIHFEFCGSGSHHKFCSEPTEAIRNIDPTWDVEKY